MSFSSESINLLLTSFLGGIAASLTPCVYPLIPVTLAIFGARQMKSRWQAFLLSLTYVLGLSTTYTILGLVSARTGALFGSLLGKPLVIVPMAGMMILLALSSLDIIKFGALGSLQNKASKVGGAGWGGAYLMGLVSGIVAAPCVGPALAVILVIAAKTQNPSFGALLLFCFSMGLGMLFLLLGTFSSLFNRIPKAGSWLKFVKLLIATSLFLVAWYLLAPIAPSLFVFLNNSTLSLLLLVVAVALCAAIAKNENKSVSASAALLLSASLYGLFIADPTPATDPNQISSQQGSLQQIEWQHDLSQAAALSKQFNKPIMLDLFAEWCAACKELRRHTFPDPRVIAALNDFIPTELDFTEESPLYDKITSQYEVVGLPTILFLDSEGKEIANSRITGFLPADKFLEHLANVIKTQPNTTVNSKAN